MITKIPVAAGVEVVFSHNECGYAEVLDTLPHAEWVDVVTYNLSRYDDDLQRRLRQLDKTVGVRVVSNIPNRFPTRYFTPKARDRFRETLATYSRLLDPAGFAPTLAGHFNVENHAKIVMTDLVAYVGSSNFSTESADKYECGVLLRDPAVIARIRAEVVDRLVEVSAPSGLSDIDEAKLFVQQLRQEVRQLALEMKEGVYGPVDDFGQVQKRFRWEDADVSGELLARFSSFLTGVREDLGNYRDHPRLSFVAEHLDARELEEMSELLADSDGALVRLSEWAQSAAVDRHLQRYLPRATEENLDVFVQAAGDDAEEQRLGLLRDAFGDFRRIVQLTVAFRERAAGVMAELQQLERTKWGVDNS